MDATWCGLLRLYTTSPSLAEEVEEDGEGRTTPAMFSSDGRSQHTWFWMGVVVVSALVLPAVAVCSE